MSGLWADREEGYSQAKESSLSVELDELQHDMMTELRIYTVMVNGSSLTPADNHHRERGAPSTHLRHWWSRKFHLISKNVNVLVALHVMINKVRGFIFWGLWRLLSLKWVVQLSTLMFSIDGQQTDGAESSRSPAASTVEKTFYI